METKFDVAWSRLADVAKDFSQQCDQLGKLAHSALDASKKGDFFQIESRIEEASKAVNNLSLAINNVKSILADTKADTESASESLNLIESELRSTLPTQVIYTMTDRLVIFPIVATFSNTKKGLEVSIGDEQIRSNKPSAILDFIRTELKRSFNPNNFAKSMHRAFEYLSRGQKDAAVSLEEIRQLLSINRDSLTSYSREAFTHDLQRYYSSGNTEFGGSIGVLSSAPASKHQFPIFLETGNFINVAEIRFEVLAKKETSK